MMGGLQTFLSLDVCWKDAGLMQACGLMHLLALHGAGPRARWCEPRHAAQTGPGVAHLRGQLRGPLQRQPGAKQQREPLRGGLRAGPEPAQLPALPARRGLRPRLLPPVPCPGCARASAPHCIIIAFKVLFGSCLQRLLGHGCNIRTACKLPLAVRSAARLSWHWLRCSQLVHAQ